MIVTVEEPAASGAVSRVVVPLAGETVPPPETLQLPVSVEVTSTSSHEPMMILVRSAGVVATVRDDKEATFTVTVAVFWAEGQPVHFAVIVAVKLPALVYMCEAPAELAFALPSPSPQHPRPRISTACPKYA